MVSAALTTTSLFSAPSGGVVSSGNANIIQDGNITNINQSSQKASINWQSFSISPQETVNFNQPNQHSITLNRVVGHEKSVIDGALNANGQVWILNSYGVLFGKNAKVNTSGLLATTKELSDADFQKGNYNFKGNSQASIENLGSITINDSSYAAFVANSVVNSGEIKVYGGTIHLVGASEFSVSLDDNSNISLKVDKGTLDALVENNHLLEAHDGRIYLTTNAKDELLKGVVNNSGIIDISSIDELSANQNEVVLYAHGGTTNIDGTIKAKGGFVETSAKDLNITSSSTIQASKWLIDPENVTIDSGNGTIGNESVGANVVSAALDSGTDITIEANNNISVLEDIAWSSGNTFELNAGNDINIHSTIDASGGSGGKVFLVYGNDYSFGLDTDGQGTGFKGKIDLQAGENFSTQKIGEEKVIYTVITDKDTLQNMAINDSTVRYALGRDLDFGSGSNNWTSIYNFKGHFDGLGHTINNLNIDKPTSDYQGLFGKVESSIIKNIGLENVDVSGYDYVGGLVGLNDSGTISNSYTMGDISGNYEVGGLVGATEYGTISNSYATGDVNGVDQVGGLVGYNKAGTIENSYATGDVSGVRNYIGGLVGSSYSIDGTISNSYAIGDVSGDRYIGGLIGYYSNGTISNSYASGKVSATGSYIGGLVGYYNSGIISNSFYDKETNSSSLMEDILYELDKTREEILNAFSGKDGWITNGSDVEGYSLDTIILPQLITLYKPTSTLFSGGFGTNDNPYTITNWTQLQNINNSNILTSDYYFTLLNNIDKNSDGYMGDSGDGWLPIGNSINNFIGTFDGLNNTIIDLYIKRPNEHYIGLFGYTNNANIKNIGLENIDVSGQSRVGGLVGHNYYGAIENSYTIGNVSGNELIGGLVGRNYYATIENSYATGDVSGGSYVGGLVGYSGYYGTISNSYATGNVNATGSYVGGLVGESYYATILNSYASGNVNATGSYIGGLIGYWSYGNISNSFYDKETNSSSSMGDSYYGKTREELLSALSGKDGWQTKVGGANVAGYEVLLLPYLIDVTRNEDKHIYILFSGGFGTSDNPYSITNWTQLQNINNSNILTSDYYFTLLNNIDKNSDGYMGDSGDGWLPIGDITNKFTGTFDGLNSTIFDLYINRPSENYIGLFGYIDNANIKNLGLEDIEVSGYSHVSGLVGYNYYGTISNSYTTGDVSGNRYIGGLVGYNEGGTIANSYATGNISGTDRYIGGLVGRTYSGTITNSYASGDVSGDYEVGGLVGNNENGTIENSYASGDVSGDEIVGGLVGENYYATILNSYATGNVSGDSYVGGLAGRLDDGTIDNSYTTGDVSGTSGSIGGLIGTNNNGTIDNSYATGDVSGNRYIGGLVGDHSNGTIDNSYATGDVIGTGYSIGGLVGISYYGTIANSYTSGDVNGTGNYIGGLVGYNYNGTITSSYAKGNTNGDNYVGGLVGRAEPNVHIEKSFALGDVNGNYYVGGLIGAFIYSDTTLFDSYALGDVSGKDYVGGLVGYLSYSTLKNSYYGGTLAFVGTGDYRGGIAGNIFNGTIENSYYDKTKNQNLFDEDDYGKSTNELQRFSTFSYWDIVEDPDIAKGYPILAWQENKDKSIWLIHSIPKEEPKEDNHEDIQKLVSTIEQSINSGLTSPQSSFNPIGSAPTPLADDAGGSGSNADDPNFAAPLGGIEYLSVGLAQNVQIINGGIKLPDEPMFLDEDNN